MSTPELETTNFERYYQKYLEQCERAGKQPEPRLNFEHWFYTIGAGRISTTELSGIDQCAALTLEKKLV